MTSWPSPCVLCGYNGPRFYEPTVHPCMEHGSERNALLAEIERLRAERDALRAACDAALEHMRRPLDIEEAKRVFDLLKKA